MVWPAVKSLHISPFQKKMLLYDGDVRNPTRWSPLMECAIWWYLCIQPPGGAFVVIVWFWRYEFDFLYFKSINNFFSQTFLLNCLVLLSKVLWYWVTFSKWYQRRIRDEIFNYCLFTSGLCQLMSAGMGVVLGIILEWWSCGKKFWLFHLKWGVGITSCLPVDPRVHILSSNATTLLMCRGS